MRTAVVVVLLVALCAPVCEAGWGSVFNKIKEGVKKAGEWVKENCEVNLTGPDCTLVSGKRGVGPAGRPASPLDGACEAIGDNPYLLAGLSFDVVRDVFQAVDDGDDVLSDVEFHQLLADLRVIKHCIDRADSE